MTADAFPHSTPTRQPLTDPQAERALLAALISKPAALDALPVPPDAWHVTAHEVTAAALRWLYDSGARVTEAAIVQRLAQTKALEAAGGERAVYDLAIGEGLLVPAEALHERVTSLAALRRRRDHARRALAALENEDDAGATAHLAAALEQSTTGTDEIHTMQALGGESYQRAIGPPGEGDQLVPTCIGAIDYDLIGNAPRDVMLVLAPTNVGKTSFALTMLEGLLVKGIRGGLIQFEDSPRLTGDRILSKHSRVPSRALRSRDLTYDQIDSITTTAGVFHEMPPTMGYLVACLAGGTEADAVRVATRMVRVLGCQVVVFDYAQAIRCSTREESRRMELLTIGSRIGVFAARNDCVAILTSQITEDDGASDGKCPRLNQVRDCRDLSSQATSAIGLWETEEGIVMGRMLKSKVEGKGNRFAMRRGPGGMFVECDVPEQASGSYARGRR